MRIPKELTEKKMRFVKSYWVKHPDASAASVNERVTKRFGSGFHQTRLADFRQEAERERVSQLPPPTPPPLVPAQPVAAPQPVQTQPAGKLRETKRCPHCNKLKDVERDFGYRQVNGQQKPQAWCRDCRAARTSPTPTREVRARRVASQAVPKPAPVDQPNGHQNGTPTAVLKAMAELLQKMRENRVVTATVQASGKTVFQVLTPDDREVNFGGRRQGDARPTVQMH